MTEPNSGKSLGQEIAENAYLPTLYYTSYVWLIHCLEFPEDMHATAKKFQTDPEEVRREVKRWRDLPQSKVEVELTDQLVQTVKSAKKAAVGIPDFDAYDEAKPTGRVEVLQDYLVSFVGPLAMRRVAEETWWSGKNPGLQQLPNPFADDHTLETIWRISTPQRGMNPRIPLLSLLGDYQLGRASEVASDELPLG